MNADEAIEQTGWTNLVNKLEELALSSGMEGAYAVERYANGTVNVALLDPEGENVEVGLRDDGLVTFAMWYADGRDTSLSEHGQGLEEAAFGAIVDERIARRRAVRP